jgi:hypothetical protein
VLHGLLFDLLTRIQKPAARFHVKGSKVSLLVCNFGSKVSIRYPFRRLTTFVLFAVSKT